jgi:hypothetical protein
MRAYYDRRGRYRGHSEGWPGLWLRALAWLVILFWPLGLTAIGGWVWAVQCAWLAVFGVFMWYRTR